jgi:hypothetical protein
MHGFKSDHRRTMHAICHVVHSAACNEQHSAAAGSDVTKAAFISGALREPGVTLCIGNELVYREAMHVYAAAQGTRASMGLHVRTADVML